MIGEFLFNKSDLFYSSVTEMTDEEMAEGDWRSKCLGYKVNTDERAYKDGFLAGLKTGKDMNVATKWHKLEETIEKNKIVLGHIKHCNKDRYSLVQWNGEW